MVSIAGWISSCAALALLSATPACVSLARYRDEQTATRAEQTARQRVQSERDQLEQRLQSVETQLAAARASAEQRQTELEGALQRVSQTELEVSLVSKQREEASQLVDQLRGELARSGDHLRAFSGERQTLEGSLAKAESRLKELAELERRTVNRAAIVRDLAMALYGAVASGKTELTVVNELPMLRVPTTQLFVGRTSTLTATAQPVLAAVASVAGIHPEAKIELSLRDERGPLPKQQSAAWLKRISEVLVGRGLSPAQIVVAPTPPASDSRSRTPATADHVMELRVVS